MKAYEVGDIVWDINYKIWGLITKSSIGVSSLKDWFNCEVYWLSNSLEGKAGYDVLTGPNVKKGFKNVVRISSPMR